MILRPGVQPKDVAEPVLVEDERTAGQTDRINASPATHRGNAQHESSQRQRTRLRVLYREFDRKTHQHAAESSCRPGCDACCYQVIEVTRVEVDVILDALAGREGVDALRELAGEAARRSRQLTGMNRSQYWAETIPCLLLRAHQCRAYNVRPIGCRSHFVLSAPTLCAVRPPAMVRNFRSNESRPFVAVSTTGRGTMEAILLEALADRGILPPKEPDEP